MDSDKGDPSQHPRLCHLCQSWGYASNVSPSSFEGAGNPYQISYQHLESHQECLVCRLVLPVVHSLFFRSKLQSDLLHTVTTTIFGPLFFQCCLPDCTQCGWRDGDLTRRVAYIKQGFSISIWLRVGISLDGMTNHPVIGPDSAASTPRLRARYTQGGIISDLQLCDVPYFDLSTMKSWLNLCADRHGARCVGGFGSRETMPSGFRLIDTHSESVVQPVEPQSYAALSYMWSPGGTESSDVRLEKANIALLEAPGSLNKSSLPKIIWQAMSVSKHLGQRYLWVDRLCIVQDDPESKSIQIGAMGSIYSSASFTIVAALNSRTGSGLPGHSEQARQSQNDLFRPLIDEHGPNGLSSIVDESMWNRRGWTYQERLLSKRRLYITEFQAIFECSVVTAEEELTWHQPCLRQLADQQTTQTEPSTGGGILEESDADTEVLVMPGQVEYQSYLRKGNRKLDPPSLTGYFRGVEDYSSRQLSFETDILDAFNGVASVMAAGLETQIQFCIPEIFLAQCLLWNSRSPSARRESLADIPSWSWASSSRSVKYTSHILDMDAGEICSLVEFYYQDPAAGLRRLAVEDRWMDNKLPLGEIALSEQLPPIQPLKARPAEWRTNLIWSLCIHNPKQSVMNHAIHDQETMKLAGNFPGSLVFNTTVAKLHVTGEDENLKEGDESGTVALYNAKGDRVGMLDNMDRDWILSQRGLPHEDKGLECIVLCGVLMPFRARKWSTFMGDYNSSWGLAIMVVERLPCKPFVARRMAIGRVDTVRWNSCNPRWETVVLC